MGWLLQILAMLLGLSIAGHVHMWSELRRQKAAHVQSLCRMATYQTQHQAELLSDTLQETASSSNQEYPNATCHD